MWRSKTSDGTTRLQGQQLSLADIFAAIYPVGCIHVNITGTNPGTQFGGTWVAWGTGRVPVAMDTSQTEFNTVEKTGGVKSINIDHQHQKGTALTTVAPVAGSYVVGNTNNVLSMSVTNGSVFATLPPYITCYMWKRTA